MSRLSHRDAAGLLTLWKWSEDDGWLQAVHSQVLQQRLRDLERAYAHRFARRAQSPRYRKKCHTNSFRYPRGFQLEGRKVCLPKIGWVEFWQSRAMEGTVKTATVLRQGPHWFVALQVVLDVPQPVHPARAAVEVDLDIATFAALSNGTLHPPLNAYRRVEKKRARLQRQWAGMVKYFQNWKRQHQRLTRLHLRIAHCRHDFLRKLSTEISNNHAVIVMEDLQVRSLLGSARGTGAALGRRVAQKAGLNKAILDQGWGTFRRLLEYKQAWRGSQVIAVNPRYTSQTCPECGHVSQVHRRQRAVFACVTCGYIYHTDIVAVRKTLALRHRERRNACLPPQVSTGILGL